MKTILVMDENSAVRESLRSVLQAHGYRVLLSTGRLLSTDRPEVGESPAWKEFDLLLLDATLPLQFGWESCLRSLSRNPCIPIILLDGRTGRTRAPLPVGVRVVLDKPFDAPTLLRAIGRILESSAENQCGQGATEAATGSRVESMRVRWRPPPPWRQRCHKPYD